MIILKENERCPFANNCPYNPTGECLGGYSDRKTTFTCDYVTKDGVFLEGKTVRSIDDLTGSMKILME